MTVINTPYESGTPLKVWDDTKHEHRIMVEMVLQSANAVPSTGKLISSEEMVADDWAAFGRANYHAFLAGFEPMFALVGEIPLIEPAVNTTLRLYSTLLHN